MTSSQVTRNYFVLSGLYTLSASLIWGVNTLFLLDAGLSFFEVFVANAAFSAGMVIFEIPTGVVADTLGRRVSFLFSVAVLAVTTLAYVGLSAVQARLGAFLIVSIFMGLGFTFYSGAVEAWLVDALAAAGYDGELDPVFARGQMVTGVAMLFGTVGGGVLGQLNLAVPYLVRAVLLVALLVFAWSRLHDYGFTPRRVTRKQLPAEMAKLARESIALGWRQREMRLLVVMSFIQTGFLYWGWYAWQPYFLELLGRDAVWVAGVVSALMTLAMIGGNSIDEFVTRFCGRRTTILLWAVGIQAVAAIGVGVAGSFWLAVAFFALVAGAIGVISPIRQAYIHHLVPSEHRATVLSFDSMIGGAGGVGGQVALGAVGRTSVGSGYIVGGAFSLLALPVLFGLRRLGGTADRILGAKAGVDASCAAQGTPPVAGVNPQTVSILSGPESS